MGYARPDALMVHAAACKEAARKPTAAEAKAALLELAYAAPEGHPMRDRILGMAAGIFLTALVLPRKRTGRLLLATVFNPRMLLLAPKLMPVVAAFIAQRQAASRRRARASAGATTGVGGAACPVGLKAGVPGTPAQHAGENGEQAWPPVVQAVASDLGQPRSALPYCDGAP